jgi:uncharacterized protein (DUF58 family)
MLFLKSPYPWFRDAPNAFIPLDVGEIRIEAAVTPPLAGPAEIKLDACVIDPWGLSQIRFEISPVKLVVIPRARYADFLARKYLSGSKTGRLPLVSNVGAVRSLYGLRQGIEFYGNRMYQPGDNLKNIDWKHSVKYNELVTREFFEIQGQPVILLINLVAGDAEETDKLAYNSRGAGTDDPDAGNSQGNSYSGQYSKIAKPAGRRAVTGQHQKVVTGRKYSGRGIA